MRRMPVTTNQRGRLQWKIAETGVPRSALLATKKDDPIMLRGSTIDVMRYDGGTLVHFCRSSWQANGFERLGAEHYEDLSRFSINFLCPVPEYGIRYAVDAELYFNGRRPVLAITQFANPEPIPADTTFLLNDLHEADWTTDLPVEQATPTPRFRHRRSLVIA